MQAARLRYFRPRPSAYTREFCAKLTRVRKPPLPDDYDNQTSEIADARTRVKCLGPIPLLGQLMKDQTEE